MNATKVLLWIVATVFTLMDVVFIYDLTVNHRTRNAVFIPNDVTPHKSSFTGRAVNSIDLSKKNESKPTENGKFLDVKILSSKEKAIFTINGKTVLLANGDKDRGINIVVVDQYNGAVLTKRCFDTYYPGGSEKLEIFLESIMSGRYLFFAIKDEATYSLKDSTRQNLRQMGSHIAESLHWRDMWVFAVQKHGPIFGEDYAKSPSLTQWGDLTAISVTIPLGSQQTICKCKNQ